MRGSFAYRDIDELEKHLNGWDTDGEKKSLEFLIKNSFLEKDIDNKDVKTFTYGLDKMHLYEGSFLRQNAALIRAFLRVLRPFPPETWEKGESLAAIIKRGGRREDGELLRKGTAVACFNAVHPVITGFSLWTPGKSNAVFDVLVQNVAVDHTRIKQFKVENSDWHLIMLP
jgi:hypothetical protein